MAKKKEGQRYKLEIPLDASQVEGFEPEQGVKVAVQGRKSALSVETVKFNKKGRGMATFTFNEQPGALHVIVGPDTASDDELLGLQTITVDVSSSLWQKETSLTIAPVAISAYYWFWWLRWCREFVIRGRVVCPDGSPVPGAEVCTFDVDRWWAGFYSKQKVGCNTTDINGAFEIRFRWCCGWWPWWWWRQRVWHIDPAIQERISPVLKRLPDVRLSPRTSNQPNLSMFRDLLPDENISFDKSLAEIAPSVLEDVRQKLIKKLGPAPELEMLRIWPWYPWWPWWDCVPDIIFEVTQDCVIPGTVIVDEDYGDTRWDIPTSMNVTLVANEEACCYGGCQDPPCPDGECLVITRVCGEAINDIGGNTGAAAAPEGYLHPNAVLAGTNSFNGDRPFAGIVPVEKNTGDMLNVDYYEIEMDDGTGWGPLPAAAAVDFHRRWMELGSFTTGDQPFKWDFKPDLSAVNHLVVESREHFEANGPFSDWWPGGPGADRIWMINEFLVVPIDSRALDDGTYHFRVVGWEIDAGGNLTNRRILPICTTEQANELVLTFDNQIVDSAGHPTDHNCDSGVHHCTLEPDTHISAVRVNGVNLDPCATIDTREGTLEIEFLASDVDGHLGGYTLSAHWGLSDAHSLLNRPGASVTPIIPGTPTGWQSGQNRGVYGVALSPPGGATAPQWEGGAYRLTVPLNEAFPDPCCYQLRLRAWKRTVVGYKSGIRFRCGHVHDNHTEYTIGIGV